MSKRTFLFLIVIAILMAIFAVNMVQAATDPSPANPGGSDSAVPWWGWPLILLIVTFVMGILAVLGGVGGAVLYTPIIGGFFPSAWTSSGAPDCCGAGGFAGRRADCSRKGLPTCVWPCRWH